MSLNINRKLLLLAALSVSGLAALSAFSMWETTRVYDAAIFANDNTVPAIKSLKEIESAFDNLNINLWQRLAETDSKDNATLDKAMRDDAAQIEAGFKTYEPTVVDDKDKAMLAADRAALGDFLAISRKAVTLIDAGRREEARFLVLQNQASVDASNTALDSHYKYNIDLAQQADDSSAAIRKTSTYYMVSAGLAIGIVVLAITLVIRRAILKPLTHAGEVLARIGEGRLDNTVTITNRDEIGTLLGGLEQMQATLRERGEREREAAERERATAVENGRIRTALDRVSAGAMLADVDGNIIYMNDSIRSILRLRAGEIRKALPTFDAEGVLGSSIDAFHRAPSHQRNMLSTLASTHQVNLSLGDASLRLMVNPVTDPDGKRIGTVVEWADRTVEAQVEREVQSIVARAVEGDLTGRIAEEGKEGFFKSLAADMNSLIDNMTQIVRTMGTASGELISGAEEISKGNTNLSQRTEEQASSLEETASSMEQITATVKNAADHAAQADQLAAAARKQAENGGAVVASAVTAMGQINESSKKIADIIGVIDEIAFQTNLLALNAAVEAARAGEQGRGFAVVASEVRSLAGRSATAAKEIKTLINDSVARVEEGSSLVEQSGKTLSEIVLAVKKVTDIVSEIASGTQEQSSGIEQINKAVMQMDETTQQNAALVEQAAAASQAIVDQAHSLNALVARYKIEGGPAAPAPQAGAEGRAAQRPWTGAKPSAAAAKPARAPLRKVANGPAAADGEWESF